MNYITFLTLAAAVALASARPQQQFSGNPFLFPNQGQQYPNQQQQFPNQGFPNQGFQNQGFPSQGFQNQGFPSQGFPNQQQQFPNQGQQFPNQQQQFPQQPFPNQGQNQQFLNQGPNQGSNQQQFPNRGQNQQFPQQQNSQNPFGMSNNQSNLQQPNQNQTGQAAQAQLMTTPAFIECNRNCITTTEYSPICGSDQVTYNNIRRLECANRCGQRLSQSWQDIQNLRPGACTSGQRVA